MNSADVWLEEDDVDDTIELPVEVTFTLTVTFTGNIEVDKDDTDDERESKATEWADDLMYIPEGDVRYEGVEVAWLN